MNCSSDGNEPSYAGSKVIESPTYEWQHSLGEIVTALVTAGLRIEFLHEFPFNSYPLHPAIERGDDGGGASRSTRVVSADVLDQGDEVISAEMERTRR